MNSYVVNLYPVPNDGSASETLVVNSTPVQFSATIDSKTTCCMITVHDADVIVTFNGTTPTITNGHVLIPPFYAFWSKDAIRAVKMVQHKPNQPATVAMTQFTY